MLLPLVTFTSVAWAQKPSAPEPKGISDNSFLIEEAYNQEEGVVQHINTFLRSRGGDWSYTFTQEWPVKSMKHQFSFTITALKLAGTRGARGLGDVALNYRYQLVYNPKVAVAPRVSLLLPTGSASRQLGAGGVGFQTNLPVSVTHSSKLVTHWNAGATLIPRAKDAATNKAFLKGFNLGQSTIWLARPRINVLMETVWNSFELVSGPKQTATKYTLVLNPGVRWAYNFKNGLQIVPGVAFPIGIGPSSGERGIFLYLSFEHPFKKLKD
jgi:hypothetical protein